MNIELERWLTAGRARPMHALVYACTGTGWIVTAYLDRDGPAVAHAIGDNPDVTVARAAADHGVDLIAYAIGDNPDVTELALVDALVREGYTHPPTN
jgi:hypothetical protein